MKTFEPISLGSAKLRNRIIRSATYEGCSNEEGVPGNEYLKLYENFAKTDAGGIITGFTFTSEDGKAMQNAQAGIENDDKIGFFREVTERVHRYHCPVFLQISHAGRQSIASRTGGVTYSASKVPSKYFRSRPKALPMQKVNEIAREYGKAAKRAMLAGFDGVQVHAAHGYLIHQFILTTTNKRKDRFGIDRKTKLGLKFLEEIILSVRNQCGNDYPILVKISGSTDLKPAFDLDQLRQLILFLDKMKVAGIEISYGTMEHPLNIIRGSFPLDLIMEKHPFFNTGGGIMRAVNKAILKYYRRKQIPFEPAYNVRYAAYAKSLTDIPIISVGGFRTSHEMTEALERGQTDIIGLSRPFISEPDLVSKMKSNPDWVSECTNCNHCVVMCDSGRPTICYKP